MATNKKTPAQNTGAIRCDMIEATAATQIRKRLDKSVIDAYQDDLVNGDIFPPIDVFREENSDRYILADGFHRLYAHIHAGFEDIAVTVHAGTMHDCLMHAAGANSQHGLRRTNSDKRHAVEMCLKDPEIGKLKRQEIADICRVTKRTVQKIANIQAAGEPEPGTNGPGGEAEDAQPSDQRPSAKPEPTQIEIERDELREALKLIKAFPYGGEDSTKLELNKDDVADLEYVSAWCAHAVLVLRK